GGRRRRRRAILEPRPPLDGDDGGPRDRGGRWRRHRPDDAAAAAHRSRPPRVRCLAARTVAGGTRGGLRGRRRAPADARSGRPTRRRTGSGGGGMTPTPVGGWLHRRNPTVKLVLVFVVSFANLFLFDLRVLGLFYAAAVVGVLACRAVSLRT